MTTVTVREDINGAAREVWNILGDFGGVRVGGPVTSFRTEGEGVGMVRHIGMGDATIVERLDRHDADAMEFAYSIINDDGPLPVADYAASVTVTDRGDGRCEVVWTGTFEAKGAPEAAAAEIIEGIYRSGIAGARQAVEG